VKTAAMLLFILLSFSRAVALTLEVTTGELGSDSFTSFDIGYFLAGSDFSIGPQGDSSAYGAGSPPGSASGAVARFTAPVVLAGVIHPQPPGGMGLLSFSHDPLGVWGHDGAVIDRPFTMTGGVTVVDPARGTLQFFDIVGGGVVHAEFHLVQVLPPPFDATPIFTVEYRFPEASSLLLLCSGAVLLAVPIWLRARQRRVGEGP
jgi:hypothetical protein